MAVQDKYNQILFVMDQGIGNMIMATPALQAIKQTHPNAELTVLGNYPALEIVKDAPFVDKVITELDESNPHQTFDLALLSIWSDSFHQRHSPQFLSTRIGQAIKAQLVNLDAHESEYHLALAKDVGFNGEPPSVFVPVDALYQLPESLQTNEKGFVVLADTFLNDEWKRKRWPYFYDLATKLMEDGYQVVVVGGKREQQEVGHNPKRFPEGVHYHFGLPLSILAKLISQSNFFVGNDSGPAHLAGALNIPTYILFGATRWTKNKPLGENVHVIHAELPCSPCQYESWWNICTTNECMSKLSVDAVCETVVINHGAVVMSHGITPHSISRPKQNQRLVAVMRIKDAIDTIEESLDSVSRVADKICIVDNGSTDGTFEKYNSYPKIIRFDDSNFSEFPNLLKDITIKDGIVCTKGLDEPRDRRIMDALYRIVAADWVLFIDADEVLEDTITRDKVESWMNQDTYSSVWFRHCHFWNDKYHYRTDQRWKPRHRRGMWRVMSDSHIIPHRRTNPEVVYNLKGRRLDTDFVVKHYGHIDKQKNEARQALWRSIDNESHADFTGMSYAHMTDETQLQLERWKDAPANLTAENPTSPDRFFGNPSLLIVMLHGGGDCLMLTPTIRALKQQSPNLEISVMGLGIIDERDFKTNELFENNPDVTKYYDSSLQRHPTWWNQKELQEKDYPIINKDIAEICQLTSFDNSVLVDLQQNTHLHRIDRLAHQFSVQLNSRKMDVNPTQADRRWAASILGSNHLTHGQKLISVHRFCGHPPKSWSHAKTEELCQRLTTDGHKVILWDQDEREKAHEPHQIEIDNPNVINMRQYVDELTICRSAALMEICDLHVGADSLPMHLANAVGIPTIGIFEKTRPHETAPMTDNSLIITTKQIYDATPAHFIEANANRMTVIQPEEIDCHTVYSMVVVCLNGKTNLPDSQPIKTKKVMLDGDWFTIPLADEQGYKHTNKVEGIEGSYTYGDFKEQQVQRMLLRYIQPDWVFGDLGANIGFYSGLAATRCQAVHAFEVNPQTFKLLEQNLVDFQTQLGNITLHPFGIASIAGNYYLNHSTLSSQSSFMSQKVHCKALDDLGIKFDMLKIDVEGFENDVLVGGVKTIENVKVIIVELHPNKTQFDIRPLLEKDFGFNVQQISPEHLLAVRPPLTLPNFPVNCAYDPHEIQNQSHIQQMENIGKFANQPGYKSLVHNPLKWFDYIRYLEWLSDLYCDKKSCLDILDIGGGLSIFPFYLAQSHNVVSLEPDKDAFEITSKINQDNLQIYNTTIFDFPAEVTCEFDSISCVSVIEHIENDTETVLEAAKYIKAGGIFQITTDFYHRYIEYPNANRELVPDSQNPCDSRIYDYASLYRRIIEPLEKVGLELIGDTNFDNTDLTNPYYLPVRGLYSFARMFFRKIF